MRKAWRWAA